MALTERDKAYIAKKIREYNAERAGDAVCPTCGGSGEGGYLKLCPDCRGTGRASK